MYLKEEIIALEPNYVDGIGNMTLIHGLDGSIVQDGRRISTIFKHMAKYDLIDMEQIRKIIRKYLNINKNIPYVFNEENIYIPIKTRKPIGRNDGASTFVKISNIDSYKDSIMELSNGEKLKILEKKKLVERRIRAGMLAGLVIKEKNYILHNILER